MPAHRQHHRTHRPAAATQTPDDPLHIGSESQRRRWDFERALLEQQLSDQRRSDVRRTVWIILVMFLLVDLAIAITLILVTTA